ncbi:MAG: hypothetical protein ABJN22_00140 [Litorimonas sp.]
MRRALGLIVLISALAACQSTAEPYSKSDSVEYDYTPIYFADVKATPTERKKCEAVGVVLQNVGIMGIDICHQDLPDSGKICRDSDECLSECMADESVKVGKRAVGQCSLYETNYGCLSRVENGRVEPVLCVD